MSPVFLYLPAYYTIMVCNLLSTAGHLDETLSSSKLQAIVYTFAFFIRFLFHYISFKTRENSLVCGAYNFNTFIISIHLLSKFEY